MDRLSVVAGRMDKRRILRALTLLGLVLFVLSVSASRLAWLFDDFVLPERLPNRVAFSAGIC